MTRTVRKVTQVFNKGTVPSLHWSEWAASFMTSEESFKKNKLVHNGQVSTT